MPAKSKLTPKATSTICEGILLRMTMKNAAMRAGISETTFFRWLREGEAAQGKLDADETIDAEGECKRTFWQAIKEAEADGELALLAHIHKAARSSWQAAAWILERRHPEHYSRRILKPQEEQAEHIEVTFHVPPVDEKEEGDDLVVSALGVEPEKGDNGSGSGSGNGGAP